MKKSKTQRNINAIIFLFLLLAISIRSSFMSQGFGYLLGSLILTYLFWFLLNKSMQIKRELIRVPLLIFLSLCFGTALAKVVGLDSVFALILTGITMIYIFNKKVNHD